MTTIPDQDIKCLKCMGCGQIANDEEGTPWSYWEKLPYESAAAIIIGLIKPITCPECRGTGGKNG